MRGWVRAAFGSHLVKTSGLSVLSALLFAVPVAAGPWAQQEGSVFLSVTLNAEDARSSVMSGRFDVDPTMSVFGELGLGRSFTAGLELDWGTSSEMGTVFLRYTLTEPAAQMQIAFDGGISHRSRNGQPADVLYRLGASLGSGFEPDTGTAFGRSVMPGGGWMALDGAAFLSGDGTVSIWRAEATLGANLSPRIRAMLSLKAEEWPESSVLLTMRPSVVLSFNEGTSLQAGLVAGLGGSDAVGMSLSIWQEF
jgi:hypothetical protein